MIGIKEKAVVRDLSTGSLKSSRVYCSFVYKLSSKYDTPITRKDMRITYGDVTLKYAPKKSGTAREKPYLLRSDILTKYRTRYRFKNMEEIMIRSSNDEELAFLCKYCDLLRDSEIYLLAKTTQFSGIKIGINWLKYKRDFAKANGWTIDDNEYYINVLQKWAPCDVEYYKTQGLTKLLQELKYIDEDGNPTPDEEE
jgi:hypothetical protein